MLIYRHKHTHTYMDTYSRGIKLNRTINIFYMLNCRVLMGSAALTILKRDVKEKVSTPT